MSNFGIIRVVLEKKSVTQTPKKANKMERRFETELDRKIKGLLTLPSVKKIKNKAHEYRIKTEASNPK